MTVNFNYEGVAIIDALWRRKDGAVHFKIGPDIIASIAEIELQNAICLTDWPLPDGRWRKCRHSLKLEVTQA